MGDSTKAIIVLLSISVLLLIGQVSSGGKPFGKDVLDIWLKEDTSGTSSTDFYIPEYQGMSDNMSSSRDRLLNISSTNSGIGLATGGFNFWDIIQFVWGFIIMILNIIFIIPFMLLSPDVGLPSIVKLGLIVPIIIVTITVIILNLAGKK